jgi:hypothetical protein
VEIIKQGDLSRDKCIKHFKCIYCGCEFLADKFEYRCCGTWRNLLNYVCKCPYCRRDVYLEE